VLSRQSGNLIVKPHCVAAELNPRDVSAHELRSGISPRDSKGVTPAEGMQQPQRRSIQQAAATATTLIGQRARRPGWRSERPSFAVRHQMRGHPS
jgi:hypothetical protein